MNDNEIYSRIGEVLGLMEGCMNRGDIQPLNYEFLEYLHHLLNKAVNKMQYDFDLDKLEESFFFNQVSMEEYTSIRAKLVAGFVDEWENTLITEYEKGWRDKLPHSRDMI